MVKKLLLSVIITSTFSWNEQIVFAPSENTAALLKRSKAIQVRAEKVEQHVREMQGTFGDFKRGQNVEAIKDDEFVNIEELSNYFVLDMKYATSDNFLKEAVYACAKCYMRGAVAKVLLKASKDLMKQGYRIKLFDCYRPHSVQKKMWKLVPDPGYVANPKGGSVHNRGAALDITLTDLQGNELDMGTPYDHFGKEAAHAYAKLPEKVIKNRKLLRKTMEKHGFTTIRTEWWHYNFKTGKKFRISDFNWKCK